MATLPPAIPHGVLARPIDAARGERVIPGRGAGRLLGVLSPILLALLVGCQPAAPVSEPGSTAPRALTGEVVGVADGDTLTVLLAQGQVRVRVWGVDAPEHGQPFGARAKQLAGQLAFGQMVRLESVDVDRYGRMVARVILPDGRDFGQTIVAAGLAWWYRHHAPKDNRLEQLEAAARAAKRGLWSAPNPVPPWAWREKERRNPAPAQAAPGSFTLLGVPIAECTIVSAKRERGQLIRPPSLTLRTYYVVVNTPG